MHYSFHPHNSSAYLPFHAKKMKVLKGKLLIWAQQWENWDSKSDVSGSRVTLKPLLNSYFRSPGQLLNCPFAHPSKFDLEGPTFQPVWLPDKRWFCEMPMPINGLIKFHTLLKTCSSDLQRCIESFRQIAGAQKKFVWLGSPPGWGWWVRALREQPDCGPQGAELLVGEGWPTETRWLMRDRGESSLTPLTCCTKFLVVEQCGYSQESCCLAHHLGGITWSPMGSVPWMNLWIFSVK